MIHYVRIIDGYIIDFVLAIKKYDEEAIVAILREIEAPGCVIVSAKETMRHKAHNLGYFYLNKKRKRGIVVIDAQNA